MMNIILLLIFTAALGLLFLLRLYNKRKKYIRKGEMCKAFKHLITSGI